VVATRNVVVLGGGIGGQVAASRLRRLLPRTDRVTLVERNSSFSFAPSYLWVLSGARRPAQISASLGRLQRAGVELVQAEVQGVDLERRRIATATAELSYDRLVVALGTELAPEVVPGLADAGHNVYSLEGAAAAGKALAGFDGGRVVILVSRLPFKCPAAPYEAAFLAQALLKKRGLGDRFSVAVYTPEPLPMPTAGPAVGQALAAMLRERGIEFQPGKTVESVDVGKREVLLSGGERAGFDLLLAVPPHRPPKPVRGSALASETGYVPVDPGTLATRTEGVYAIGDVTTIPVGGGKFLPKAGVFAHGEAEVVAHRIAAELAGEPASSKFDGKGSCFVELGGGRAAYASGNFYAEGGPEVRLRRRGRIWHWAKVALEQQWLRLRL
jgi:sulfide:quinone oxidoreductase